MFETDRLPDGWALRLNSLDEVWVPTEFSRGVFKAAGVTNLRVLGEGVDHDFFRPSPPLLVPPLFPSAPFLSVFKWEERKGWRVLLAAFLAEFETEPLVSLVILTAGYHQNDEAIRDNLDEYLLSNGHAYAVSVVPLRLPTATLATHVYTSPTLPTITLLTGVPQPSLPSLYSSAAALVLPSRGEGWGRPHMER